MATPPNTTPRRRGRRPLADKPMTGAERQRAYRARLHDERFESSLPDVSRITLLAQLATCLGQLESTSADADLSEGASYLAEGILAEVIGRYRLDRSRITKLASRRASPRPSAL